jgi:5'-3' exonuclease
LVEIYMEGLVWVLKYYYEGQHSVVCLCFTLLSGVRSWKWYFPYRYSPLASDMVRLRNIKVLFRSSLH